MTEDRWVQIKKKIQTTLDVVNEYTEDLDPGTADVLEFKGPLGLLKARFVIRPKLLDKKTSYSNRIGSDVKVDYVFSEEENVSHLELFQFSEEADDWIKLDSESLFN